MDVIVDIIIPLSGTIIVVVTGIVCIRKLTGKVMSIIRKLNNARKRR